MKLLLKHCQIFLILCLFVLSITKISYGLPRTGNNNNSKFIYIEPKNIIDLIATLNELGKLGYKLKIVERYTEFFPPEDYSTIKIAGIVELQEGDTFEYEWLAAKTLPEIDEKLAPLAEKGYYFSNRISYSLLTREELPSITAKEGTPEKDQEILDRSIEGIKQATSEAPIDGNIFILERKNKKLTPIKFKFITAIPAKSIVGTNVIDIRKITDSLEDVISETDTINYLPVSIFFSSKVFKTRVSHLPTILFQNDLQTYYDRNPVYKVVETFQFASKFRKKMDLASQSGFNIQALYRNFALTIQMDRKITYLWLETKIKDFPQKLASIADKRARFLTNEISYTTDNLVFEIPQNNDNRFEYYVLKITEKPQKPKVKDIKPLILTNEESIQKFNELINQGYSPRTLFYKDGMNVLFERQLLP